MSAHTSGKKKKKRDVISLEVKREIIEKHDRGIRIVDIAKEYGRTTSTISTIIKQKEAIKAITPAKGVSIISKLRNPFHEEMENLLLLWIKDKQLSGDNVTTPMICEKARVIYNELQKRSPGFSENKTNHEGFKASHGWFEKFKKRTGIHSVIKHGETASSDVKAEVFVETFDELTEPDNNVPHQVTGLLWTEDLLDLRNQEERDVQKKIDTDNEEEKNMPSSREIKDVLQMWDKVIGFVSKNHPDKEVTERSAALYDNTCLRHFRAVLKRRQVLSSLDKFLRKRQDDDDREMTQPDKNDVCFAK